MANERIFTLEKITYFWNKIKGIVAVKADISSPSFTGTPTAPTAAAGTNTTQIATTAFVMNAMQTGDAMVYRGTIGSSGATISTLPDTHSRGWTYKVITAGTYAGHVCEIGDMIICIEDGTSANNGDWTVVQSNLDGAVIGPSSSTANNVAIFSGTTGKIIADGGFAIESKAAASGGNVLSLVTTGEKYTWNNKYTMPAGGIPYTDIANGVIPDISGKMNAPLVAGLQGQVLTSDGVGGQSWQTPSNGTITDVRVDNTSVVSNGVALITSPDISGKLDSPVTAGTSGQVLTSNGNGGQTWADIPSTLPTVTSSDEGKILMVVSGVWAATELLPANGVSF